MEEKERIEEIRDTLRFSSVTTGYVRVDIAKELIATVDRLTVENASLRKSAGERVEPKKVVYISRSGEERLLAEKLMEHMKMLEGIEIDFEGMHQVEQAWDCGKGKDGFSFASWANLPENKARILRVRGKCK